MARVIDPVVLREKPDLVKRSQRMRGEREECVDEAIAADTNRRAAISEFETLRAEQNVCGKQAAAALVAKAQELAARVKVASQRASEAEVAFTEAVQRLGNIVIEGVPAGGE